MYKYEFHVHTKPHINVSTIFYLSKIVASKIQENPSSSKDTPQDNFNTTKNLWEDVSSYSPIHQVQPRVSSQIPTSNIF